MFVYQFQPQCSTLYYCPAVRTAKQYKTLAQVHIYIFSNGFSVYERLLFTVLARLYTVTVPYQKPRSIVYLIFYMCCCREFLLFLIVYAIAAGCLLVLSWCEFFSFLFLSSSSTSSHRHPSAVFCLYMATTTTTPRRQHTLICIPSHETQSRLYKSGYIECVVSMYVSLVRALLYNNG